MDKYNLFALQVLHKAGLLSKKEHSENGITTTEMMFTHAVELDNFELDILEKKFEASDVYRIGNPDITSGMLKHQTVLVFKNVILSEPNL